MCEVKQIPMSEVLKHNKKDDLWLIIHHNVYDASRYLENHPGGEEILLEVAGKDSTVAFEDAGHSQNAREIMEPLLLGRIEGALEEDDNEVETVPMPKPALSASEDINFQTEAPLITAGRAALKVALSGATLFLAYEVYTRSPKIGWLQHSHGGFWRGVLLSSIMTLSVAGTAGFYLEKGLSANEKTPYSYPAHFKPKIHIAKPITKVKGYLKPEEYQRLPLVKKQSLSHDTYLFTFKLPTEQTILGLPIGQHISIRTEIDGKSVSRSYTPVSNDSDPGELRLLIKIYDDGQFTGKYLKNLEIGDHVEIRGPKGTMRYRKGMVKELGMIAGGTGITPMYQVIRAICENPTDKTRITLLYGNRTESDIILRSELDDFASNYPQNFQVSYVLSDALEDWKGRRGYITKEMVKEKFPKPRKDTKALLCGPPGLLNSMKKGLVELGWDKPKTVSKLPDQVFCF